MGLHRLANSRPSPTSPQPAMSKRGASSSPKGSPKKKSREVTDAMMKAVLPQILKSIPKEWQGTTFANSNLLGREGFSANLKELVLSKAGGEAITTDELVALGNAED